MTPEQMWDNFMELLKESEPIREASKKKGEPPVTLPHLNLIGSAAKYRKIFVQANTVIVSAGVKPYPE
ncbi:hypothetical protein D3C87_324980 [compost metagenome]